MKMSKKSWLFWIGLALAEAAAVLLIARWQGMSADAGLSLNARCLSDGCFVAGIMATGIGLMTWVATTGFFDMMSYGVQYGVRALIGLFGGNRKPNGQTFYDYKMERDEKRGKPVYAMIISGVLLIALSFVFVEIYYRA